MDACDWLIHWYNVLSDSLETHSYADIGLTQLQALEAEAEVLDMADRANLYYSDDGREI